MDYDIGIGDEETKTSCTPEHGVAHTSGVPKWPRLRLDI